ncbi:hypothetical protein OEA41_004784 [Lepraria neglecta]|uniref:Uncharacterized protein n=1 Tax=Lepraria neglecta TaxID=209136 RepID=A0AAD9Z1N8_9LECA|nr:hypothetical protein OEA41_004784 [Lepraria neglecta]
MRQGPSTNLAASKQYETPSYKFSYFAQNYVDSSSSSREADIACSRTNTIGPYIITGTLFNSRRLAATSSHRSINPAAAGQHSVTSIFAPYFINAGRNSPDADFVSTRHPTKARSPPTVGNKHTNPA